MAKVWAVTVDGRQLQIWDLPIEDVDELGTKHGVGWLSVIDRPMQTASLARDLVEHAAKKLGVAVPVLVSARQLFDSFEVVDDDLPIEYVDGIPKADGAATTG